jgi:hypothetical protein
VELGVVERALGYGLGEGSVVMSYPSVGMSGILPDGVEWDAVTVEKLLRDGHHIYFEDPDDTPHYRAEFSGSKFRCVVQTSERVLFESGSFVEFAVWCAFMGRDFL